MINNVAIVEGHTGKDPSFNVGQSGTAVCKTSLAVYRSKTVTDWLNIVAFNSVAETLREAGKGSRLKVYGSISVRTYDKDGQKQVWTEIIADHIQILPKRDKETENGTDKQDETPVNVPF